MKQGGQQSLNFKTVVQYIQFTLPVQHNRKLLQPELKSVNDGVGCCFAWLLLYQEFCTYEVTYQKKKDNKSFSVPFRWVTVIFIPTGILYTLLKTPFGYFYFAGRLIHI